VAPPLPVVVAAVVVAVMVVAVVMVAVVVVVPVVVPVVPIVVVAVVAVGIVLVWTQRAGLVFPQVIVARPVAVSVVNVNPRTNRARTTGASFAWRRA